MSLQTKFSETVLNLYPSAFEHIVNEYNDELTKTSDGPECLEALSVSYRKLELIKGTFRKHKKRIIRERGSCSLTDLVLPPNRTQLPKQPEGEDKSTYFADLGSTIIDPYRRFTPSGTIKDVMIYCEDHFSKHHINAARIEEVRVYR